MYKSIDAISIAEAAAMTAVMQDRMRYVAFLEAAEHYIHKNELVISGTTATRLLLGSQVDRDTFQTYELYTAQAHRHARALANMAYRVDPDGLGHYTKLITRVADEEYTIDIDGRELFRIRALPRHKDRAADAALPATRPSFFARSRRGNPIDLLCMPPEIRLLEIYRLCMSPNIASEWANQLKDEKALRGILLRTLRPKIARVFGGGRRQRDPPMRRKITDTLVKTYLPDKERVVIGAWAIKMLLGQTPKDTDRIQVIATRDLDEEAATLEHILEQQGGVVQSAINNPMIPTDPRIRRLTVKLFNPARERYEPIIDVFNVGQYELVPFTPAPQNTDIQIGTLFALMRFRLIDIWTIQMLHSIGQAPTEYVHQILLDLVSDYEEIALMYAALLEGPVDESAYHLFPIDADSYIGQYESAFLYQKRAGLRTQAARKYIPPYYPARDTRG